MKTLRCGVVLSLLLVFPGVGSADDLIRVSMDDANGIAQVVADTYTEYTGDEWVALSPVELRDDSTDELVGYLYLITNNLEAGATTIEGLESEAAKANETYPQRFTNVDNPDSEYNTFRSNYQQLIVAAEYAEYPIIDLERSGYELLLNVEIEIHWRAENITDTDPTNYEIIDTSYQARLTDGNWPLTYIKYTVKSCVSGEELTLNDKYPTIEYWGTFKVQKNIKEHLRSIGLLESS